MSRNIRPEKRSLCSLANSFLGPQENSLPQSKLVQGGEFGIQSGLLDVATKTLLVAPPPEFAAAQVRASVTAAKLGSLRVFTKLFRILA